MGAVIVGPVGDRVVELIARSQMAAEAKLGGVGRPSGLEFDGVHRVLHLERARGGAAGIAEDDENAVAPSVYEGDVLLVAARHLPQRAHDLLGERRQLGVGQLAEAVDVTAEHRPRVAAAAGDGWTVPGPKLLDVSVRAGRHHTDRMAGLVPRTHVGGGPAARVFIHRAVPYRPMSP